MKLLFLCKRRPMGRDMLTSPYGRFYHLPLFLAKKGHDVSILLGSYKIESDQYEVCDENGIRWYSVSLACLNPFRYYWTALQLAKEIRSDWIVGFSDTYYGIIACRLARSVGCKSLIDAYDNYESYIPFGKPLHYLWRSALSKADVVSVAGPSLVELIKESRQEKSLEIVPMAADPVGFEPLSTIDCRKKLGLPLDKKLIGYCGTLHKTRGVHVLFEAFSDLRRRNKHIELVISGRKDPGISSPEGVRWLGYLSDERIPLFLNSMDVLTILNKDSKFGNYSYPVKLYEAMSCQIPVVASSTKSVRWILKDFPEHLVAPEDQFDLSKRIVQMLDVGRVNYGIQQGWESGAALFERALE